MKTSEDVVSDFYDKVIVDNSFEFLPDFKRFVFYVISIDKDLSGLLWLTHFIRSTSFAWRTNR